MAVVYSRCCIGITYMVMMHASVDVCSVYTKQCPCHCKKKNKNKKSKKKKPEADLINDGYLSYSLGPRLWPTSQHLAWLGVVFSKFQANIADMYIAIYSTTMNILPESSQQYMNIARFPCPCLAQTCNYK